MLATCDWQRQVGRRQRFVASAQACGGLRLPEASTLYGGKRFQSYKLGAVVGELGLGDKGSVASSLFNFASLHQLGSQRLSKPGELCRYSLQDCQLSLSIWQELSLRRTAFDTSWLCRSPIESMALGLTGRAAETFVIGELRRSGLTIPSWQCQPQMAVRGGHVVEVLRGLHRQL